MKFAANSPDRREQTLQALNDFLLQQSARRRRGRRENKVGNKRKQSSRGVSK